MAIFDISATHLAPGSKSEACKQDRKFVNCTVGVYRVLGAPTAQMLTLFCPLSN